MLKPHRMISQCPASPPHWKPWQYQQKTLGKEKLNFSRCALSATKTGVSLRYFVSYCLWKLFFDSNSPQTPSNLISVTFLVTLRPFTWFSSNVRAIKWPESPKPCLTWWLLFRSFHWGWNLILKELRVCFRTFFRKIEKIVTKIWQFLTNLTANRNIKSKRKFCRQSVS